MIIQFARIFSSSVYHDDPCWTEAVRKMSSCSDEETLTNIADIIENSGYIQLTPVVYNEFERVLSSKDVPGFFTLYEALLYPVFSASLICVLLRDIDFLRTLIKNLSAQQLRRTKTTMGLLRDRWMDLVAKQTLEKEVNMGDVVKDSVAKPIDVPLESQLVDDIKEMIKVLGAEDMFRWAIEIRAHRTFDNEVKYDPDIETVAFNRLRLFVLNKLPELVTLNTMGTDGQHLPYMLYMLSAYVRLEPTNTSRIDELLKKVFDYLNSDFSPTCCNEELYNLIPSVAKAYALSRNKDNAELLSLLDGRRVNREGWKVVFHHKPLEDDDTDTDKIMWPVHYMQREQQEVLVNLIAWYLLGEKAHFNSNSEKEIYYDAIVSRLFSRLRTMNRNDLRVGNFDYNGVVSIAYKQTCNHLPSKKDLFVDCLMRSVDELFDLLLFWDNCKITFNTVQKNALKKRFKDDWLGERKVEEILNVYNKQQLDAVEAGLKQMMK